RAVDGAFGYSINADLCGRHPARCLPAGCTCGGPAHSPAPGDYLMNRVRRPPHQHPLALLFDRAIDSFTVSLSPDTTRHYRGTARNFLSYLGADYPEVQSLDQLRREPHILGWMSRLHSQVPPLVTASYNNLLFAPANRDQTKHSALDRMLGHAK